MDYNTLNNLQYLVFGLPPRLELIMLAVFPTGPWVRFALLASMTINLTMSESFATLLASIATSYQYLFCATGHNKETLLATFAESV